MPRSPYRGARAVPVVPARVLFVVLVLVLAACGGSATPAVTPTSTTTPRATIPAPPIPPPPAGDERKVDTVLLDILATLRTSGRAAAEDQARAQGVLTKSNDIRVTLILATADTKPVVDKVQAMGGRIGSVAGNAVDVVVPLDTVLTYASGGKDFLQDLAAFKSVREIRVSEVATTPDLQQLTGNVSAVPQALMSKIVSEGVATTGADKWQAAGITGKGVRVGIIDTGFAGYESLLGVDLPAKVTAKSFTASGALYDDSSQIHGTAVAEIVYAMAPDADLSLAAIATSADFMRATRWMVDERRVQVIQASLGWYATRGDGTGIPAEAVDYARTKGVLFVSAAGNEADGHYMAAYTDPDGNGWHEYAPGVENLRVTAAANQLTIYLRWDAWGNQPINYDLYLLTRDGKALASSRNDQGAGKIPVETVSYRVTPGQTYLIRVAQAGGAATPVRMDIFARNASFPEYDMPASSIATPADARGGLAVAAVQWKNDQLEAYSSQGPTLDGRPKPDLAGPTKVSTATYTAQGKAFIGTSAAAPHVSGAAALVFNVLPSATTDSVTAFLESRARDLTEPGRDNKTGYGGLWLGEPTMSATPLPVPATPAPIVSPASSPATNTSQPPAAPSFEDRFTNVGSGLPMSEESQYEPGRYVIRPNVANRAVWATYGDTYTAVTVEVTVTMSGSDGMVGVVFWQRASDDYYVFAVTPDGYYQIARYDRGTWRELTPWTKSAVLGGAGPQRLKVETRESTVTVSANGASLTSARQQTAGAGRAGLMAATFNRTGLSAAFTSFQVTPAR